MPRPQKRTWQAMIEGSISLQGVTIEASAPPEDRSCLMHPMEDYNSNDKDTTDGEAEEDEDDEDDDEDGDEDEGEDEDEDGDDDDKGGEDEDRNEEEERGGVEERQSRRQHKGNHRTNPFIDDEAAGGETSEDEDVDMEASTFVDDNEQDDDLPETHLEINAQFLQATDSETRLYLWEHLLDRAYERVRGGESWCSASRYEEDDHYIILSTDLLWAVPCKAGDETQAIFAILNRASHPTTPNSPAPSTMFNPSHPGPIYVEASSAALARVTVDGIPGLSPSQLRLVPHGERWGCMSHSPRCIPLWVRICDSRSKWKAVNGSVGIIVPDLNGSDMEEVWNVIVAHRDPLEASAPWSWQAVNFSDIRFKINLDDLPTVKDIQRFSGCNLINEYMLNVLFECIYCMNIRPGARVVVTAGEFVGLIGEMVMSLGATAKVRFDNGLLQDMLLRDLRRNFVIGDQAIISTLPWRGTTGWVTSVEAKHITIWSDATQREYRVAMIEAEFFMPSFRQTSSLPPRIKHRNISDFNIYDRFKGRMVYVTGHHPFKGQRGQIKDTHPNGRIWVQMESILCKNEPTIFKHTDISLIEDATEKLLPIHHTCHHVAHTDSLKAPFSSKTGLDTNNNNNRPSGLKSPSSHIEDLPIIDSSITFPRTDPIEPAPNVDPYWLVEACFSHRIKLAHVHDPNHIVQLLGRGSSPGMVQVRDHMVVQEIASHTLAALPPSRKDDMVVVISGEHIGNMYKVVKVMESVSWVKKLGRVLRKNEVDPTFPNDKLVQAFGPFKK